MPRGRYSLDVEASIRDILRDHPDASAQQVQDALRKAVDIGDVPSLRTLQRHLPGLRRSDTSGAWSAGVHGETPEEARIILRALNAARRALTVEEAKMTATIGGAVPEVSPYEAFKFACEYLWRRQSGESTEALDWFLAFIAANGRGDEALVKWRPPAGLQDPLHLLEPPPRSANSRR